MEAHLDKLFSHLSFRIAKWENPVTYDAIALPPEQISEFDRKQISLVMQSLGELSGLSIIHKPIKANEPPPNLLLLFSRDTLKLLNTPLGKQLFGLDHGNDVESYEKELKEWAKATNLNLPYSYKIVAVYSDSKPIYAAATLNLSSIPAHEKPKHIYDVVFSLFTRTYPSDEMQPSWANTGRAIDSWETRQDAGWPEIDKIFIQALYQKGIQHGDHYSKIRDILIDMMMKKIQ